MYSVVCSDFISQSAIPFQQVYCMISLGNCCDKSSMFLLDKMMHV